MSGLKSRNKGKRGEYEVRDYFRKLGYEADRVPMSGAAPGYKGDVRVRKDGKEFFVEVKVRKDAFNKIYEFFNNPKYGVFNLPSGFVWNGTAVAISPNFEDVSKCSYFHGILPGESSPQTVKILNKILKLREFLVFKGEQVSDYLVIKGDRQPLLFFRFI